MVRHWKNAAGEPQSFGGPQLFSFSDDGRLIALIGSQLRVLEIATGQQLFTRGNGQENPAIYFSFAQPAWKSAQIALSPNGRTLAAAWSDNTVRVWDVVTGQELHRFAGHEAKVESIAFSPDGRLLASAGEDDATIVWTIPQGPWEKRVMRSPEELQSLVDQLASSNPKTAFHAAWLLQQSGNDATALLERLLLPKSMDENTIQKLIGDLESARYAVRSRAVKQLSAHLKQAEGFLKQKLKANPTLEMRMRIAELLQQMEPAAGWELRQRRGILALERIGGAEARRVLVRASREAANPLLASEARAALRRMPVNKLARRH